MSAGFVEPSARLVESSYDAIAALYEHDMERSAPRGDMEFYAQHCESARGPLLELACGTGRVGLQLAKLGHTVIGLDRSREMLRVAAVRASSMQIGSAFRLLRGDLNALPLRAPCERIVLAYSALTYLAEEGAAERLFRNVRAALKPEGKFLLDVFRPQPQFLPAGQEIEVEDYVRSLPDGRMLTRSKLVRPEIEPGINEIRRRYHLQSSKGETLEQFETRVRIRPWYPGPLLELAQRSQLEVVSIHPDFQSSSEPDLVHCHTVAFVLSPM